MNTPFPEYLRGVKPGDSPLSDPRGRVIVFEFPYGERYPNQVIRQWKLAQGLSPNEGVVMPSRYRGDQRYPYRTKHNQYFIWMGNERALHQHRLGDSLQKPLGVSEVAGERRTQPAAD